MSDTPPERAIEDHGIVGDTRTAALVATDGTIDFLCWPRFDSPSVFAAILDRERGGAFELAPVLDGVRHRQMYLPGTAILLTRFLAEDGVAEVSDFMAWGTAEGGQRLVRRAKAVRGTLRFRLRCDPRPDYARTGAEAVRDDATGGVLFAGPDGAPMLRLLAEVPVEIAEDGAAVATFEIEHGHSAYVILEDAGCEPLGDPCAFVASAFKETANAWRAWSSRTTYRGRWRDEVDRSAITLKLLTSREHGAMVAAPTFGLPEAVGGGRNWDYRYAWVRDAAFTVYALLRVGHTEEADSFVGWLQARIEEGGSNGGPLDLLYGIDGHRDLAERELPHLRGYRGSRPVRVGNDAAGQLQLDIYGEAMDAIYLADKYGRGITFDAWEALRGALDWLAEHWHEPDEGIWEVRGGRKEMLHSRLMCWVAFDRALRLATKRSLPAPVERWRAERDRIHRDIHANFWSGERRAFVQSKGSEHLDAACLLMPLVRFIAPTDPRWLSTLDAVGRELTEDSLVYRYSAEAGDGLAGGEGTFNMCSFWYIECLARAGDVEQARYLFDKMLGYANHLGLFAEETGLAGEQLGNMPQAFTHMALISAAVALERALGS